MDTVKLSSFDRFVNIHQSLELNQTRKINTRILQEQILQNAELQQLNKQLFAANDFSRRILENQIREIEHKETQRFYKKLSFNTSEFVEPINNVSDPLVKKYFIDRYYKRIEDNILAANDNLDEISDKVFNKAILTKINEIKISSDAYQKEFNESPFKIIDDLIAELKIKREQIEKFKPFKYYEIKITDKPKVNFFRMFGLIVLSVINFLWLIGLIGTTIKGIPLSIFIFEIIFMALLAVPFILILRKEIKWRKLYQQYKFSQNQKRQSETDQQTLLKAKHEAELKKLNNSLLQDASYKAYQEIIIAHPEFEKVIDELNELEIN